MKQHLHLLITGGTIDSIFDPAKDMVVVNDASTLSRYIHEVVHPDFTLSQETITLRDSREISDHIREELIRAIQKSPHQNILITHGTYTMAETARYLEKHITDTSKKIVLTGSMLPLQGFAPTDAPFNLGFAIASVLLAQPGIYLAMNGRLFKAHEVEKNVAAAKFEAVTK